MLSSRFSILTSCLSAAALTGAVSLLGRWLARTQSPSGTAPELLALAKNGTTDCPYEYILETYGRNHFRSIVVFLDPGLEDRDPTAFRLILSAMDAIHFGAILVDDIADNSLLRKGLPTAHRIYGEVETTNRAYLRIFEILSQIQNQRSDLSPFIVEGITEIHKGQDLSLTWRRYGLRLETDLEQSLALYRNCASLKTGSLFRMVGRLVTQGKKMDQAMSNFGWYCQLQNDCKNVFSTDVVASKGVLAEDLVNGEYSYPIIVALHAGGAIQEQVSRVMCKGSKPSKSQITAAANSLQDDHVRQACLHELNAMKFKSEPFATLWG